MKRLLSITLLLSAVHLQASDRPASPKLYSESELQKHLQSRNTTSSSRTEASSRGLKENVSDLALEGAHNVANELLGDGGADKLAALMAKLEAAQKNPTVAELLDAAQMTAAIAAQLAPLFNADGLAKVKKGCLLGCTKGMNAQTAPAGAPTRGNQQNARVKIVCTKEQAEQVQRLLGAVSTHTPTVKLSSKEIAPITRLFTTHALRTTRTTTDT